MLAIQRKSKKNFMNVLKFLIKSKSKSKSNNKNKNKNKNKSNKLIKLSKRVRK